VWFSLLFCPHFFHCQLETALLGANQMRQQQQKARKPAAAVGYKNTKKKKKKYKVSPKLTPQ